MKGLTKICIIAGGLLDSIPCLHRMARRRCRCVLSAAGFAILLTMIFYMEWHYLEGHQSKDASQVELYAGNTDTAGTPSPLKLPPAVSDDSDGTIARTATRNHRDSLQPLELEGDEMRILKERKSLELRVEASERALWWYIRARTSELLKDDSLSVKEVKSRIADLLQGAETQHFTLSSRIRELERAVEKGLELEFSWKAKLARELSELMQKRLDRLQNPLDCSAAKKLVCNVARSCGFGCQIHHVAYCFITAYATERTLILRSQSWKYSPDEGWEGAFLPASGTCKLKNSNFKTLGATTMNENTLQLPYIDSKPPAIIQKFLPPAVPRDLADKLETFHGYPIVWFIGQFVKYLLRPNVQLQKFISEKRKLLGVKRPIVGIHVRRTDKLKKEASYHSIEEYMNEVEEWYKHARVTSEQDISPKRVYIASDDPTVYPEAKKKYPEYTFISDQNTTKLANDVNKRRNSIDSLYGVILDVMMLSECDYVVCTFSSQICRLVYELMQTDDIDASSRVHSLDDIYFFAGGQLHSAFAIDSHSAQTPMELSFLAGDRIEILGNEKNGYSVGERMSTARQQKGIFPSYKVENRVLVVDFPTYPDIV